MSHHTSVNISTYYFLRHCLASREGIVTLGVCVSVCVSAELRLHWYEESRYNNYCQIYGMCGKAKKNSKNCLDQCCPTYGPRAACGPRTDSVRPEKELSKCCKKILTMFVSTYVCEAGFSALTNIKSKKRNSLTDEHLEDLLRAAVTQYQQEIKQVAAAIQSQPSHWH